MSTLHGSWILQEENGYFFIWGETWRTSVSQSLSLHPFNLTPSELIIYLQSQNLSIKKFLDTESVRDSWHQEIITLPSERDSQGQVMPILSGKMLSSSIDPSSLVLHPWRVEGLRLYPLETAKFFRELPISSFQTKETYLGSSVRFWGQIYRWIIDLLARGKFLPGIFPQSNQEIKSCWQPLLDSVVDRSRLAKFTQLMPPACRAFDQLAEPSELLLGFLSNVLDAQLRTWLEIQAIHPKTTTIPAWLQALSQTNATWQAEPTALKRIETAIATWELPVQDYLVSGRKSTLKQNLFRTCFSLLPPSNDEVDRGEINWKLNYGLQAVDDPEFLLNAETIWQHPQHRLIIQNRPILQPQETLLKGLGLASRLYSPIADSLQESQPIRCELSPIQVYEFIRAIAWQLQDNGLEVILPPGLTSTEGEKRLGIKITAEVSPQKIERLGLKSLLNYKLELAIGGQNISKKEFEKLLAQRSPLVKINEEWIALQPADVRAAQAVLAQTNEQINLSVEDALRLSTGETKILAKLPVVNFEASGVLQELINNLTNNQAIKLIQTPKDFRGELRPYQVKGASWLAFLERWGLGACLADDMGLGKSIQTIAFLLNLREQNTLTKPTLLVCPTSILNNWEREVKKFAPTFSTLIHHGDKRSKGKIFAKEIKNKNLVITSYPLVFRDEKTFLEVEWQGVILDEAQNIKNPQSKQSQAVRKLKAGFHIALTGTPVENRLSELWSILDFLNPGYLGTQQFFQKRFAAPIEKYGDRNSLYTLRSLVQPFILRRLKTDKEIIQDLPEKQEMNVFCGLSAEQGQLYQNLVDDYLVQIEAAEGIQRHGLILTLLLKLKQVCNHPAQYLKEKSINVSDRSLKLLRLEEMLDELIAEGDRALIFTQFSEWGKLLQPYLQKKLGIEVLFLYGGTRTQQRQEMIDRFQNDPQGPRIFILSLKAGGTGLNLTRANHVFHIDRWWNPAVENQATDRVFRIGQKRNVQVHKFVCTGTLEERISDIIESKKQLAEQTVNAGEQWLTQLDTNQLRQLLLLDRSAVIDDE